MNTQYIIFFYLFKRRQNENNDVDFVLKDARRMSTMAAFKPKRRKKSMNTLLNVNKNDDTFNDTQLLWEFPQRTHVYVAIAQ